MEDRNPYAIQSKEMVFEKQHGYINYIKRINYLLGFVEPHLLQSNTTMMIASEIREIIHLPWKKLYGDYWITRAPIPISLREILPRLTLAKQITDQKGRISTRLGKTIFPYRKSGLLSQQRYKDILKKRFKINDDSDIEVIESNYIDLTEENHQRKNQVKSTRRHNRLKIIDSTTTERIEPTQLAQPQVLTPQKMRFQDLQHHQSTFEGKLVPSENITLLYDTVEQNNLHVWSLKYQCISKCPHEGFICHAQIYPEDECCISTGREHSAFCPQHTKKYGKNPYKYKDDPYLNQLKGNIPQYKELTNRLKQHMDEHYPPDKRVPIDDTPLPTNELMWDGIPDLSQYSETTSPSMRNYGYTLCGEDELNEQCLCLKSPESGEPHDEICPLRFNGDQNKSI